MTTAASSITRKETRWARAVDRSSQGLEVRHLRMFLAEVDKAGIADDARVSITDKLQGSSTFHDVEIESRVESPLDVPPGTYPALVSPGVLDPEEVQP